MENNNIIKLHNNLGQARYKLDLSAQKFLIFAIMKIDQEKEAFEDVEFTLIEFSKFADVEITRLRKDIKRIVKDVMSLVLEVLNSDEKWAFYNLTQRCAYDKGSVKFKFNSDMKNFLLDLRSHYYICSPEVIKFKSWSSIRLYDLLRSVAYKQIKHNEGEFKYNLEELKKMLGLEGKYNRFNSFREKVIEPAMSEINKKTDISFTYEKIARGRKVVGLKFIISEKMDEETTLLKKIYPKEKIEEIKIKSGIEKENFNIKQIIELCEIAVLKAEDIDVDIHDYIRINYEEMKKKKTVRNKFAWLKKALEEDYASAIAQIKLNYRIGS
ncbi:replication initiation protein [Lutibacter sp. B2]|nr:replication initiation protein [Lutibacter sp. B2]